MAMMVRAFPLRRDLKELHRFREEVERRKHETDRFYTRYGVRHESWHLQNTEIGDFVLVCTEIDDVKTLQNYRDSEDPFERWFKSNVMALSGLVPKEAPEGPPSEQIFEWNRPSADAE